MRRTRVAVPPRIAAHLIVGSREEPFLGALLQSLESVAQTIIVNDNSRDPSPHAAVLQATAFAARGSLIVDRTPFSGFANARNVCMSLHRQHDAGDWVTFVDADEVHGETAQHVAAHLDEIPAEYDAVDAYTWHFAGSFDWYMSIERRLMFYRFRDGVHWEGAVHEQLRGLPGKRVLLPYVYAHYGHTLDVQRHAEKEWQYTTLGAPGKIRGEAELQNIDVRAYLEDYVVRAMRFRGEHPAPAKPVIERLRTELAPLYRLTEEMVRARPPLLGLRNAVRYLNYEQRWRFRALSPLARRLVR